MEMIVFQMWPSPIKACLANYLKSIKESVNPILALEQYVSEWIALGDTGRSGWIMQQFREDHKRLQETFWMLTKELEEKAHGVVVKKEDKYFEKKSSGRAYVLVLGAFWGVRAFRTEFFSLHIRPTFHQTFDDLLGFLFAKYIR